MERTFIRRNTAMEEGQLSCTDCGTRACQTAEEKNYPNFCLTRKLDPALLQESLDVYVNDAEQQKIARISAELEGEFYCRMTRVEETIEFILRMGCPSVGIASCVGLLNEARIFARLLHKRGIDAVTVGCKIGAVDKSALGIPDRLKVNGGCGHESMCNPVLQAKFLNSLKTDLNVMIGLCVGHDSLFIRNSEAPVTVMVVKDRVLGHNPAAALYMANTSYSRFKS